MGPVLCSDPGGRMTSADLNVSLHVKIWPSSAWVSVLEDVMDTVVPECCL